MDFTRLEKFQDFLSDEWRIPGSSCVAYVDGKEVYRHSSGFADVEEGRRMTGDELLYMFSITKIITTLAALQLLEKGLFHLNDPLSEYMPEFKSMKVRRGEEIIDSEKPIRVRDLFSMTAGYDYCTDNEYIRARKSADGSISTMEMAKALAETPLRFEPGERWEYGMSHDILAAFVEKLSGERFSEYVRKNIFEPVGMRDSFFHITEEQKKRMASLYNFNDETGRYDKIPLSNWAIFGDEYDSGGAGLISTVSDVAKLANVIAMGGVTEKGTRIISNRTIDLWKTNCLDEKQLESFSWEALAGYGYGLGVRTHIDPSKSGSLSPVGEFGWTGAAGGFIIIDTENRVGFFYAHHMTNNQENYTTPRLRNVFYSCIN